MTPTRGLMLGLPQKLENLFNLAILTQHGGLGQHHHQGRQRLIRMVAISILICQYLRVMRLMLSPSSPKMMILGLEPQARLFLWQQRARLIKSPLMDIVLTQEI